MTDTEGDAAKITQQQIDAGQAVYSKRTLNMYDWLVLGISNHWIWKCPTKKILALFQEKLSDNHLDVGVGTGYYLDKVKFQTDSPRVALLDLNPNCLQEASQRIQRYAPETYQADLFQPLELGVESFESISLNYVFHCLPGNLKEKAIVLEHLKACLLSGGRIFGSTILQGNIKRSWLAQRLMNFYNRKGIFCNSEDTAADLKLILEQHFKKVEIQEIGCVALFSAVNP